MARKIVKRVVVYNCAGMKKAEFVAPPDISARELNDIMKYKRDPYSRNAACQISLHSNRGITTYSRDMKSPNKRDWKKVRAK